jgi:alpha-1,6-mannosyltransferase
LTESKTYLKIWTAFIFLLAGNVLLGYFVKRDHTAELFSVLAVLFSGYYYLCRLEIDGKQFYILIGAAIMLRLVWLFAFPDLSDDYARFVWDGRLTVSGHNPFKYLPADIMKSGLTGFKSDTVVYKAMNSQTYYTCYPPLLQMIFAIAAWIFPNSTIGDVIILRLFNMAADIGSIYLLIRLCEKWKVDTKLTLWYAINPMVIAELTGNLHYEGVMIFFILLTVWFCERKRLWLAVICFTASVITKLIPLMLLPLFLFYWKGRKGVLFCSGVLLLTLISFLPFFDMYIVYKFWSSINSYFRESEYNASIYYLVRDTVMHFTNENKIEIVGPILTLISGVLLFFYAIIKRSSLNTERLLRGFSWTLLIYYAFTTTIFSWYITPLIAFSVFTHYKFPIVWSATIMLSYYADRTPAFEESNLLIWIEYAAVAIAVVWDLYQEHAKRQFAVA